MTYNLGFIGGGKMSSAISTGIIGNGTHPVSNIWVSGPHMSTLEPWKAKGAYVTTKNGEVYSACEVVFLGVKPGMLTNAIEDCMKTLPQGVSQNVLVISMLAGITIAELQQALKIMPNKPSIIRIMPNLPVTVGAGICLYTPAANVSEEQCRTVEKLMGSCGICEKISESLMDSLGSLTGCGPAYIFIIIEALADAAVKLGAPRSVSQRLAAQMVMGSGQLVVQSQKHPAELKDEVCSPGGSTIAGVAVLEDGKIRSSMIRALEASTFKTKELGKK